MIQGEDKIGEWTVTQLVQFLTAQRDENPPTRAFNFNCDTFISNMKASFLDQVQFYQYQTTVGATGSASALPANPLGYFKFLDRSGTSVVVPYYTA